MEEDRLIVELVKDFIAFCEKLLEEERISEEEYHNYTLSKKEFLAREILTRN